MALGHPGDPEEDQDREDRREEDEEEDRELVRQCEPEPDDDHRGERHRVGGPERQASRAEAGLAADDVARVEPDGRARAAHSAAPCPCRLITARAIMLTT